MLGTRAQRVRRQVVAAAFLVLAACGVGSTTTPVYVEGIIGPGGGTLEAEGVTVFIPPGALDEETVCAIVPGPDDLPIDPGAGEIDLLPGCKCVGPRGTPLAVAGTLRICYDPDDIPAKFPESALVLLEWDEAQGFLVVVDASHDTKTHCFEDGDYDELGYVVVGAPVGGEPPPPPPDFDFMLFATDLPPLVAPQGGGQTGILLADTDPLGLPPRVLAGTGNAFDYLGSFDGSRILYTVPDFQAEATSLRTVDTESPFDDREVLPNSTFASQDPLFGWLGEQDRVFHNHTQFGQSEIQPQGTSFTDHFSYREADGTGPVVDLASKAFFTFLDDVRVSPDRTKVMLRWIQFGKGNFYTTDIIAIDGTMLVSNVAQFFADGRPSPRWMPDSSGIYFPDDEGTVTQLALRPNDPNFPDGYEPLTLYSLTVPNSVILDFVVAPNFGPTPADQRCAFIRRDFGVSEAAFGDDTGPDFYDTDTLGGTDHTSVGLGDFVHVVEMVPAFAHGSFQTSVVLVQLSIEERLLAPQAVLPSDPEMHTLVFDLASTFLLADIPAPLSDIDISRGPDTAGQTLVWIQQTDVETYPEYPTPGVYLLDTFFANPVNVTPPAFNVLGAPRWLQSWRTAPGHNAFNPVVR
jgi:hypothetical protein